MDRQLRGELLRWSKPADVRVGKWIRHLVTYVRLRRIREPLADGALNRGLEAAAARGVTICSAAFDRSGTNATRAASFPGSSPNVIAVGRVETRVRARRVSFRGIVAPNPGQRRTHEFVISIARLAVGGCGDSASGARDAGRAFGAWPACTGCIRTRGAGPWLPRLH